jgi:hypothetical protein
MQSVAHPKPLTDEPATFIPTDIRNIILDACKTINQECERLNRRPEKASKKKKASL